MNQSGWQRAAVREPGRAITHIEPGQDLDELELTAGKRGFWKNPTEKQQLPRPLSFFFFLLSVFALYFYIFFEERQDGGDRRRGTGIVHPDEAPTSVLHLCPIKEHVFRG